MKKTIIIAVTLVIACITFQACGKKVSVDKLKAQIKEAMLEEARDEGSTLVITEMTLNEDGKGNYKGVARGTKNDSVKVTYNVSADDQGDEFDVDWDLAGDD
ncbi:MAG: hypothetical protein IKX22_07230 [Prevotella sp.]|nr:hypothetical protein [Prevotella sp.]